MGWGPDPIWTDAKVISNEAACRSGICVTVHIQLDPDVVKEYTVPGQYVQLRQPAPDSKPLFLAIASPPSTTTDSFEFLIKKTEDNAWLTDASSSEGTAVQISQVLGNGFPIQENLDGFKYDFPAQNIMLFAVGSGIAPIKAAMESGQLQTGSDTSGTGGASRTARLYYGVRNVDDLCYTAKFVQWEQNGIEVVPVLSQPASAEGGEGDAAWQGRAGYIQNALEEDGVPIPRNSGALLCGMKGMTESVKDILTKAGVFEGRQMTNF